MKTKFSFLATIAIAAGTLLGAATGCELIAGVDRSMITTGGSAGAGATGGGGSSGGTSPTTGGTAGSSAGTAGTAGSTGCVDPAKDCDPPSGECKAFTCDADKMCVEGDVNEGGPAATQTDGDCKQNVCKGGAVMPEDDNTDPLDDMNECTTDSCQGGTPKSDPAAKGAACTMGGTVCDGAGLCVECNENTDCKDALKPACSGNKCIPATCNDNETNGDETDKDCGGSCTPCADTLVCKIAGDCQSGVCMDEGGTLKCQAPTCTDTVKNGMEGDVDCGASCPTKCGPMKGCNGNGDCVGNECTAPMNGVCTPNCQDQVKNGVETDTDCGGGTCGTCGIGKECANADANCDATAFCNMMSKCTADKPIGQTCMGAGQCVSGNCIDTVCCNSGCSATCQSCNLAGLVGTCSLIPSGQDPEMECPGNGGADVCDGSGSCGKVNGSPCAMADECVSNQCIDGVCCDGACNGICRACSAAKTGGADGTCANIMMATDPDAECTGNLTCAAGACEPSHGPGVPCTIAAECASGFCTDGVCCNAACGGACRGCNVAGTVGSCALYAAGTDPENECSMPDNCSGSGTCGP